MEQKRFDELVRKHGIPGASLAVLAAGDVSALASGVLNLSTGVEATTDSLFQIASITKVYTATVFMRLVEQGLVGLDTHVVEVLPDFALAEPGVAQKVTMRHLLSHTSGIGSDFFRGEWRGDDCVERYVAACVDLGQDVPLGATTSYSNAAFCVLGRVIEVLTGLTWDQSVAVHISEPLGLTHTWTLPEEVLRFRAAMGHFASSAADPPVPAPFWELPFRGMGPCGSISTTASELIAFAQMHLTDPALAVMREPQAEIPVPRADHWGLGWLLWNWEGRELFGHSGDNPGQSASLVVVPDAAVAIALQANIDDGFALFDREVVGELLLELCGIHQPAAPAPPETPYAASDPQLFAGRYERFGAHVEVTVGENGGLHLVETQTGDLAGMIPDLELDLVPVSEGRFVGHLGASSRWTQVTFAGERFVYIGLRAATKTA
jgi:CubicO group peptidase (beta-lactamase class C family)